MTTRRRPASRAPLAPLSAEPDSAELIRARKLKDRIEHYWGERGHLVCISLEEIRIWRSPASLPHRDYAVRSDLVNGLPAALRAVEAAS